MEVLFVSACIVLTTLNFLLLRDIKKIVLKLQSNESEQEEVKEIVSDLIKDIRSLKTQMGSLSLPESQSPQSPMKPNNWDSIREAFKGPVRTEANERT